MTELLPRSTYPPGIRRSAPPLDGGCRLSVIVPVGPGDDAWRFLLPSLARLAKAAEVCFVGAEPAPDELHALVARHGVQAETRWVVSLPGRAGQMNHGARCSKGEFLWFLHADSRFSDLAFARLSDALIAKPQALHYFDLSFDRKVIERVALNEWGARFRSRVLRLPFGDQGFCLRRELFESLGQFDESVPYGEDHLLVWNCHRLGAEVSPVRAALLTSPRKYRQQGWLRTTILHGWRTWRQAFPQLWLLMRSRWG